MVVLPSRRVGNLVAFTLVTGAISAAGGLVTATSALAASDAWPSHVSAVYRVRFAGFDIGTFNFNSSVHARNYVLSGDARLSALLGAFKWRGLTRTAGRVRGPRPQPAAYTFDFKTTSARGFLKMSFKRNKVAQVSSSIVVPGRPIPLKPSHLKAVYDPLSALMVLTRKRSGANPCKRTLKIFDGKHRFDLKLTFKHKVRFRRGIGYACSVRYQPIAGHVPNAETRYMASSKAISIVLRPVPGAKLVVPHQISIPTMAGTATLTAERIDITTDRQDRIALVN
ncbi:MAG: DUF3108 domain-containing protein [Pseudomonadota bacterium]